MVPRLGLFRPLARERLDHLGVDHGEPSGDVGDPGRVGAAGLDSG